MLNAAMPHPRPLVLLVDDHADTRELYQLALPYEGFAVIVAESVERAMQCVTEQHPDVIVTDLSMPACDGYAFLRWLHGRGEVSIPVIALTAWGGVDEATRARAAGCLTVCVKPCLPDALAAQIRAALAARGVGT